MLNINSLIIKQCVHVARIRFLRQCNHVCQRIGSNVLQAWGPALADHSLIVKAALESPKTQLPVIDTGILATAELPIYEGKAGSPPLPSQMWRRLVHKQ